MKWRNYLFAGTILAAAPAFAGEEILYQPIPEWVDDRTVAPAPDQELPDPVIVLLSDRQERYFEAHNRRFYRYAYQIGNPQGLGNASMRFEWDPLQQDLVVHHLRIHRGDEIIDITEDQSFTVLRRERDLNKATLDGRLTATLQPEGIEVGDIIEYAISYIDRDAVVQGRAATFFGFGGGQEHGDTYFRFSLPADRDVDMKLWPGTPEPERTTKNGWTDYSWQFRELDEMKAPNRAPLRYRLHQLAEITDYGSWQTVADLVAPHFAATTRIEPGSALDREVDKIAAAHSGRKERIEAALQLVQQRVRYVNLALGTGGLIPADPDTTWKRRFGDCKGKTVMLMAVLDKLGIESTAALVDIDGDDALGERMPMMSQFDHVLVKLDHDGKTYWLDGTRQSDTTLEQLPVPGFDYALPLTPETQLEAIAVPPKTQPDMEMTMQVDAGQLFDEKMRIGAQLHFYGEAAVQMSRNWNQVRETFEEQMKNSAEELDEVEVELKDYEYDEANGRFSIDFDFTGDWQIASEQFDVELIMPSFLRAEERDGEEVDFNVDAPFAINHPTFTRSRATVILPEDNPGLYTLVGVPRETEMLGGQYVRTITRTDNRVVIESMLRSVTDEVPYEEAIASKEKAEAAGRDWTYFLLNFHLLEGERLASLERYADAISEKIDANEKDWDEDELETRRASLRFIRHQVALAYAHQGDNDTADPMFDTLLAQAEDAWDYNLLCWEKGLANVALDRALEECTRSLDMDRNEQVLDSRGLIHLRAGRFEEAMADYREATEMVDADESGHYAFGLALAQVASGQDDARQTANDALAILPNAASIYCAYGFGSLLDQLPGYRSDDCATVMAKPAPMIAAAAPTSP